jgi:hypothetical protein
MTYSIHLKIKAYLVFGYLLWVEINVFFGKEFISDFGNI